MSEPRFTQTDSAFAMTCLVEIDVRATAAIIWTLLTDSMGFPRWNSTITAIDGQIREGERLRLHVPGTSRTFTPRVSSLVPGRSMVWSDGVAPMFRGVRTFTLEPGNNGSTHFRMEEHFSGVIFALVKRMLPDFRPIFEAFASDLKREAQRVAQERERQP